MGDLSLNLIPPPDLSPVNGLSAAGDAFLASLNERFKLIVLAAYARPDEYLDFIDALQNGRPVNVPAIALVATTRRMPDKSVDAKGAEKEIKKLINWISLAINTRPIAAGFESGANAKMTKELGVNLDFSYALGREKGTRIFNETARSLSFGVLTSVRLSGHRSDNYIVATALHVGDKFVYLALVGGDRSPEGVQNLQERNLSWKDKFAARNAPPQDKPKSMEARAEDPDEDEGEDDALHS